MGSRRKRRKRTRVLFLIPHHDRHHRDRHYHGRRMKRRTRGWLVGPTALAFDVGYSYYYSFSPQRKRKMAYHEMIVHSYSPSFLLPFLLWLHLACLPPCNPDFDHHHHR
jgi:hypothetical protein